MRVFAGGVGCWLRGRGLAGCCIAMLCAAFLLIAAKAQTPAPNSSVSGSPVPGFHVAGPPVPPRVDAAQRFLAQRGLRPGQAYARRPRPMTAKPMYSAGESVWQPLGPQNVTTPYYGAVTGRVTSLAFDPSDPTGNTVYVGTTGGGVWFSSNAATGNPESITFSALTDSVSALDGATDPSISVGAVTVQPGATGVILAGTGDPNDALDSYYGAGILRSTDDGATWTLIPQSSDLESGTGNRDFGFVGLGFAGFAWSTASPQTVVAAVSEAYEGLVVNAPETNYSSAGLYYSTDAGATWHLAEIEDATGQDVQGPLDVIAASYGNSATAVVWNPIRNEFIAAVRFHGYYSSPDGVTWTRLQNQPGTNLSASAGLCPTNIGMTGSPDCPIFRGALAVNPATGDTFAWSVDENNQDQGLWQDVCSASGSGCGNATVTFGTQWSTTALDVSDPYLGDATIENGDYDFALAAIPSEQDTLLFAGDNDLWKCSLAAGCQWRNTTNALVGMCADVGPYQHAVAWNASNPLNMLLGNDSGFWRSMDDVGETGSVCSATDSTHFQNLNSGLGSLAETVSMPQVGQSSYTMMLGLGVNGTAGVKSTSGPTAVWPQILSGEGGPVAIDASNPTNWYVNNEAGVSIYECSQSAPCTQADFGASPIVNDADVGGDGDTMTTPAPFLVDPLNPTQLIIGTCRVWRGPVSGGAWSSANAISPMLDSGSTTGYCDGNALIRSIAALPLANGGEIVYVGMYGSLDGGATLAGQVFSATMSASGTWSAWTNLTTVNSPVTNDTVPVNVYGFDISSIYIDPSDPTGNTVYITVEGMPSTQQWFNTVYKTTTGGASWTALSANLPYAPADSVVVDPADPNTVYLATDAGVYATRQIATCGTTGSECWQPLGAGLPAAPVVALSAAPASSSTPVLVAGTYGRGLWQIPLLTAGTQLTTATIAPSSLSFAAQAVGTASAAQTLTVTNTGGFGLSITSVTLSGANAGDFSETDNCAGEEISAGASCAIQVTFAPTAQGTRTAAVTVAGNISGGSLTASLTGAGAPPNAISITQGSTLNFGNVEVGQQSQALSITVRNSTSTPVPISGVSIALTSGSGSAPFSVTTDSCAPQIAASSDCNLQVVFAPTVSGAQTATLSIASSALTTPLTANLSGTGTTAPTDTLSCSSSPCASLAFPATIVGGSPSAPMVVTLTNSGQSELTSIAYSVSGPFALGSSACTANLGAGSSCAISVEFVPTAAGSESGTLTVSNILKTQTVSLSGTGLNAPVLAVSPVTLSFGSQAVGSASAAQAITISNSVASANGASLSDIGFSVTGSTASSFSVASSTCTGQTLAPGGSCTANVVFTPASAGGNAATLAVASGMASAKIKPATVALSGTGTGGAITVNPVQLAFAATAVGQTSAAQTVTVTNSGSTAASGLAVAVSSGPFGIASNGCGTALAAGASCTVGVSFTPTGTGQLTGLLTVTSALSETPVTVTLSGIGGTTGAVEFSPASISFPVTGVGQTSSPVTVTITNVDTASSLTGVALTASAGFTLAGNNCTAALAAGASCTVGVEFAPTAAGAQTGTLSLASSSFSIPATATLSGTGFDFSAAISGSSSVTVASGQTGSFSLTISPLSGAGAGTFSFSCGTMPADAACSFNPASLAVAAGGSGTETVSVTTSQTTSALAQPRRPGDWPRGGLLICGVALLPFAVRRRRGLLLLVMLAVAIGAVASCSGSGGGGGGTAGGGGTSTGNTPTGTYSIPVTVSANGVQHSVTLTLTVD